MRKSGGMYDTPGEHVHHLDLSQTERGSIGRYWLHIVNNRIGEPIRIPVVVVRGRNDGPVLGLTAAIHGNELNGISVIQELVAQLDVETLHGTVVGALVLNVPGLMREQREFDDGRDLNRLAPGRADGHCSEVYVHRIVERIIKTFDVHLDLHTASFGRINSHYVRADMEDEQTARLARLQNPQIIVHNPPNDTTLRGAADALGIPSVTVELRDPHVIQASVVGDGLLGIRNAMVDLGMVEGTIASPVEETVVCARSRWLYTDEGGILSVLPPVAARVTEGDLIAEVRTIFGEVTKRYHAPADGIVVGRSVNPLNQTGSRILHLGLEPKVVPCVSPSD
jgi:uncharacterized protein